MATSGGEALRQQTGQGWNKEEDHSTSSEDQDEPTSIKEEIPRGLHNYKVDPRNLQHGELAWRFCIRQLCTYHNGPQRQGGHSPFRPTCNEHWVNCKKDACEFHLWDKRQHEAFLGHGHDWHYCLIFLQHVDNDCKFQNWQYCLEPGCRKHETDKFMNGLLRTDGDGWIHCPISKKTIQTGKD